MLDRFWKMLDAATVPKVFAAAFLIALLAALGASAHSKAIIGGEGHDGYLELAQNLVAGHGYVFTPGGHKVFHRPPLYPLLLTPVGFLSRDAVFIYISVLNSALLAGTAAVLFQFVRAFFGTRTALLAASILVINPFLLYGVKNPVSAICQMFVFWLAITTTWRIARGGCPSASALVRYTVILFAAAMSHGVILPIAFLILAVLFYFSVRQKVGMSKLQILAVGAGLILLIAPWTWRNYRVTGLFIPVAGNSGLAYFAGNAHWGITQPARNVYEYREDSEFRHAGLPLERRREWMHYYGMSNGEAERLINLRAREHLAAHPGAFGKKLILNAIEFYFPVVYGILPPPGSPDENLPMRQRLKNLHKETIPLSLYHVVLLASAIVGFFRLRRDSSTRGLGLFLVSLWAVYAVSYFPFLTFVGHSLYIYGTLPVIALLAAVCWLSPEAVRARVR